MMDLSTTVTYLFCAGSAIWIAAVIGRLRSSNARLSPHYSLESTSRHVTEAFGRLFSATEKSFIKTSNGVTDDLVHRFHHNRRQVFDVYLQQVKSQHDQATGELRRLASELDRPDLASIALRRTIRFNMRYWTLRLQLATGLPVTPRTVRWVTAPRFNPVSVGAAADAGVRHPAVR